SAAWRERHLSRRETDFAPACCLGLTANFLETVGLFDEQFFMYWEDVDLCLRMREKKIRIHYVNDLTIQHAGAESSGGVRSPTYVQLFYRSNMQILRKHFGIKKAIRDAARIIFREFNNKEKSWPFMLNLCL